MCLVYFCVTLCCAMLHHIALCCSVKSFGYTWSCINVWRAMLPCFELVLYNNVSLHRSLLANCLPWIRAQNLFNQKKVKLFFCQIPGNHVFKIVLILNRGKKNFNIFFRKSSTTADFKWSKKQNVGGGKKLSGKEGVDWTPLHCKKVGYVTQLRVAAQLRWSKRLHQTKTQRFLDCSAFPR